MHVSVQIILHHLEQVDSHQHDLIGMYIQCTMYIGMYRCNVHTYMPMYIIVHKSLTLYQLNRHCARISQIVPKISRHLDFSRLRTRNGSHYL